MYINIYIHTCMYVCMYVTPDLGGRLRVRCDWPGLSPFTRCQQRAEVSQGLVAIVIGFTRV